MQEGLAVGLWRHHRQERGSIRGSGGAKRSACLGSVGHGEVEGRWGSTREARLVKPLLKQYGQKLMAHLH